MSEHDDDNPISEFHKDLQNTVATPPKAGRSAADDIIETIGGIRSSAPPKKGTCVMCRSANVRTTRPLGGAPKHVCRECGHRWEGVPRGMAPLIQEKIGPVQTSVAGPYYRGGPALPAAQDPHTPTSRRKAKSLAALRAKRDGE